MKNKFFNKINYSACNEDSNSELKALKLNNNDVVLCITASGARSLDLLLGNPKKIISIDFNPTQNFLLELKMAAYKNLNYDDFLLFLGVKKSNTRLEVYNKIKKDLSQKAQNFWDDNLNLINKGIIYSGTWEKLLYFMSKLAFTRKNLVKKLFNSKTIEEQKNIWNNKWKNKTWDLFLKILSNRFLWEKIIKEPGFKLIPKEFDIKKYISDRLDFLLNNFLLKDNDFANLIFFGKYETSLPLHLQEENFKIIKQNLAKIKIKTIGLLDFVSNSGNMSEITAMSLSDFGSYANDEMYYKIWENIDLNKNSQIKFCERQFLLKRNVDKNIKNISRDIKLEEELLKQDKTVFYSFISGIIN